MTITRACKSPSCATDKNVFTGPAATNLFKIIRNYNNLGQYLLSKIENDNRDAIVFTDFDSGRTWTGSQLGEKIRNVSHALADKYGVKPGHVACIAYDNTDLTTILALGLICAGATIACSYPKDPYSELLYLARKVEPSFLFCSEKNCFTWRDQLQHDLGYKIVAISMDGSGNNGHNLESLLNYDRNQSKSLIPCPMNDLKNDVAVISMSSGTTGKPKAVPVTHWNCLFDLIVMSMDKKRGTSSHGQSFACCSSLDYVSGRLILFGALASGYNAVIMNGFEPETYAKAIEKFRISLIYIGAASFYEFITWPDLNKYDLSSIRLIFPMGAKVIYLKELKDFLAKYPNITHIRQGYGASELGGVALNALPPDEYLKDSQNCGRLLPCVSLKLVDPHSGKLLGHNQIGMIHIKSESTFPGYYEKRRFNAEKNCNNDFAAVNLSPFVWDSTIFDDEFYYITGDLGYLNDKEELFIIGRQNELMSCRGAKKVLPQELEEILELHPAVETVCVLGIPGKIALLQHFPRAFIVPKLKCHEDLDLIDTLKTSNSKKDIMNDELEHKREKLDLDPEQKYSGNSTNELCSLSSERRQKLAEDIMKFMNDRVGWEKQLTGGIVFLDKIPTLRTGKMNKSYLRSMTIDKIEIYGDQSK